MKRFIWVLIIILFMIGFYKFRYNSERVKTASIDIKFSDSKSEKEKIDISDIEKLSWKIDIFKPLEIIKNNTVSKKVKVNTTKKLKTVKKIIPPNLKLTGILKGVKDNRAIVNRKIVKEGDYIGNVKIARIHENYIEAIKS